MNKGLWALLGFAVFSAARDVAAHDIFHRDDYKTDPVLLTFVMCGVTFAVFYIRACLRDRRLYDFGELRTRGDARRYIVYLNFGTLIAYLTTFLAIKRIDAYSNSLIDYGASPLVTTALAVLLLGERVAAGVVGAMCCCLAGIGVLTLGLAPSSESHVAWTDYLQGIALATLSCVAASLNNVWNKRLVDGGIRREKAIVLRLPAAIAALGIWLLFTLPPIPTSPYHWMVLVLLSAFGVSIPLLLIVIAFENLRLQSLAFAMFLIPVFTYIGSLLLHHVEFSAWSMVAGITVLAGVWWAESASRRAAARVPLAANDGAPVRAAH